MGRGLELDSLRSSHPVEVEMKSSSMVNEVFDAISYCKGACSIRMLDAFLTEDVFRNGMRKYVKQFAYSNAVTTDLWACLSEASGGKPVRQMMECWTRQTGYPVVSVAAAAGGKVQLKQARFLATGADPTDDTTWMVPLRPVRLLASVRPRGTPACSPPALKACTPHAIRACNPHAVGACIPLQ